MGYLHCCRHLSAWDLGSWQLWSSKKDDHSYACGYLNNVCYQQCNANAIEHHVAKEQGDFLFFDLWTGHIASPQKEFTVFHYLLDGCTCPEVLIKYVVYSHLKFKCMCPLPCPLPLPVLFPHLPSVPSKGFSGWRILMLVDPTGMVSTATCPEEQWIQSTLVARPGGRMMYVHMKTLAPRCTQTRWWQMCHIVGFRNCFTA